MKTTGKNELHGRDKRLQAGNLFLWPGRAHSAKSIFVLIGVTHIEAALLRVMDDAGAIPAHITSIYELQYEVKWLLPWPAGCARYVDLSKLIIKKADQLASVLLREPEVFAGSVNYRDVKHIIAQLFTGKTISRDIKDKFLPGSY